MEDRGEENVLKLSRMVCSASSYHRVPMVDEGILRQCLISAAAYKVHNLKPKLEALLKALREGKAKAAEFQNFFWDRLIGEVARIADSLPYEATRLRIPSDQVVSSLGDDSTRADVIALLQVTEMQCPVPFWFAAPELFQKTTKKIGEGGFADVYLIQKEDNSQRVLKIMPIGSTDPEVEHVGDELDDESDDEEEQLCYSEIRVEISAWLELSKLKDGTTNRCPSFPPAHKISVVQDFFPTHATKAWKKYAQKNSSELPRPDKYSGDQAYVTIETDMAGEEIDDYQMRNASEAISIFMQVVFAIAVAEEELRFEHRDLHCGNILVQRTPEDSFDYILRGVTHCIPTFGVKASVIDFTYSRLVTDQSVQYLNLDDFFDPLENCRSRFKNHRYVYSKMIQVTGGDWAGYFPYTNVLWFNHILQNLLHTRNVYRKTSHTKPADRRAFFMLKLLHKSCLTCTDANDMVRKYLLVNS